MKHIFFQNGNAAELQQQNSAKFQTAENRNPLIDIAVEWQNETRQETRMTRIVPKPGAVSPASHL